MTIYDRIKYLREKQGLSQQMLAERVGFKTASAINKIELGLRDINQTKIIAFANALSTTPSYLMGWDDTPSEPQLHQNTISLIGRDGTKIIKTYSDEQMETIRRLLDAIPSEDSDL